MPLIQKRNISFKSASKILFLLIIGLLSFSLITVQSCSKKKKKKQKEIEYTLSPYSLTPYYLTLNEDSLSYIYENYEQDIYIMVQLQIGEEVYTDVKLRIRGDSSRKFDKKSLKIKLPKGSKLDDGATKINLNADFGDNTMMHQYLASKTMNDFGQLCFRAGYVPLYINDYYAGLYLRVENMDKKFLKSRNLSSKNNLYKASKDYSCMVNPNEVDTKWEKKTNTKSDDKDDLKDLIEDLNDIDVGDVDTYLKEHFFYEELINIVALNMLIANTSTYYHNYYLYHDLDKDKWRMLPWDMDKTFNPDHINYNYQRTSWAEGSSAGMNTNTLIEKLLANENSLKDLRNRIEKISARYTDELYKNEVDSLQVLIEDYIFEDSLSKIKSREKWIDKLSQLLDFIDKRPAALLEQIDNRPRNFMVDREVEIDDATATISWEPSIDPNGLELSYTVHYSTSGGFKEGDSYTIGGLKNTSTMIENLNPGKYYFFVSVNNSKYISYGHDVRNFFSIP